MLKLIPANIIKLPAKKNLSKVPYIIMVSFISFTFFCATQTVLRWLLIRQWSVEKGVDSHNWHHHAIHLGQ